MGHEAHPSVLIHIVRLHCISSFLLLLQALLALEQNGKLTYICSQNVDGLHLRSGVPRQHLAELHGNCFAERCKKCKQEYVRDFEMETVSLAASQHPVMMFAECLLNATR